MRVAGVSRGTDVAREIGRQLAELPACPAGTLPVFVSVSSGVRMLGFADDHRTAALLGVAEGISCERVSRARVGDDPRTFYVLHA